MEGQSLGLRAEVWDLGLGSGVGGRGLNVGCEVRGWGEEVWF